MRGTKMINRIELLEKFTDNQLKRIRGLEEDLQEIIDNKHDFNLIDSLKSDIKHLEDSYTYMYDLMEEEIDDYCSKEYGIKVGSSVYVDIDKAGTDDSFFYEKNRMQLAKVTEITDWDDKNFVKFMVEFEESKQRLWSEVYLNELTPC